MGNAVTQSSWTLGVLHDEKGDLIFAWGRGELQGRQSPVIFSSRTGQFHFRWPRKGSFNAGNYPNLVSQLDIHGLSAPPEAQRVHNIHWRFAEDLKTSNKERRLALLEKIEEEWRKLLAAPSR